MNYSETLDFLYQSLPMFHRVGAAAYKANLNNTILLMDLLGHPYRNFKSIHIAGTNGKGSTSHFIASIFQEMGYKTGLYTSPHLKDFRERIKINGTMIPEDYVSEFVTNFKADFDQIQPSFFEMTVALAFKYFAEEKVDIAIIETGLGGRLDSTNVITPMLSVITNIDYDHTQLLGSTLDKIAFEKAGIIKHKIPVIIGESNEFSKPVFVEKSILENAPISFADQDYKPKNIQHNNPFELSLEIRDLSLKSPLAGMYQVKNLTTVIAVVDKLNEVYHLDISNDVVRKGIQNVIRNTQLLGRWQKINDKPLAIADICHNPHGINYILNQLKQLNSNHLHFVLGMVNDKDIQSVLAMLPKDATYYFCKANIPRGIDANELKEKSKEFGLLGNVYPSVLEAYQCALQQAKTNDIVFVGGSTFTVAEIV